MTPAFTSSSLYFPMSVRSFSLGMIPASESLVALTITMNRIDQNLLLISSQAPKRPSDCRTSTRMSNERRRDRQLETVSCHVDHFARTATLVRPTTIAMGLEPKKLGGESCCSGVGVPIRPPKHHHYFDESASISFSRISLIVS